jgi:hypothetical protein
MNVFRRLVKGLAILRSMELRHRRYFIRVAEAENFSRPALELHVSPPALSRQIHNLEDGFCILPRGRNPGRCARPKPVARF